MSEKSDAEVKAMQAIVAGIGRNPRLLTGGQQNCGYCGWAFQTWLSAFAKPKRRSPAAGKNPDATKTSDKRTRS
jgi:hypothetical protein